MTWRMDGGLSQFSSDENGTVPFGNTDLSRQELMRRHILGIIAMAFLLGAAALWLWSPGEKFALLQGAAWRVGIFLAVWWLAYPDVDRLPGWLLLALPPLLAVIVFRPKLMLLVIPALIVLAVVRPRLRRR